MYDYLNRCKWHYHSEGYAIRSDYSHFCPDQKRSRYKNVFMHNFIITIPDGTMPDHIDGNGLINTTDNLRVVTPAQNTWNTKKAAGTKSIYKGVTWHKKKRLWRAQIMKHGKSFHSGCFTNEVDAAQIYMETKKKMHGEEYCRYNVE